MSSSNSRRQFLKTSAMAALAATVIRPSVLANPHTGPLFRFEPLPYEYKALEPHIDAQTMEIHYSRHHKGYLENLNKVCEEQHIHEHSLEKLLERVSGLSPAIRNFGGGHWNHTFFWNSMKPNGGGVPTGKMAEVINSTFGSFERFQTAFNDAAKGRFGSGWAWLVKTKDNRLTIGSTPNQDNPLMDVSEIKGTPLLGIDVWEHAYYLKYQNKRADYINAWWNTINWDAVAARLG